MSTGEENSNAISSVKPTAPVHMLQSAYALTFLNQEIQRYVTLKENVAYLTKLQVNGNHGDWKKIQEALTQKVQELKDSKVSVRSSHETYEELLAMEAKGDFLG